MTYSRLTQIQMLDWLRQRIEADQPTPSDDEICERFNFASAERARSLLADLAERKEITVKGFGAERVITLGREPVAVPATPRPVPTVIKRDPTIDKAAAKIVSIMKREPARQAEASAPASAREEPAMPATGYIGTNAELVDLIGKLVAELAGRAGQSAEIEALKRERDAAIGRAEAAEAKLAIARQALAA